MDLQDYIGPFLDETDENLQNLNELLLSLEQGDGGAIAEIFRIAHTLKGMSSTMGFENMASLTHVMEDVLDRVRNGDLELATEDISVLFHCLDILTELADKIREEGVDAGVETSDLVRRLRLIAEGGCPVQEGQDSCDMQEGVSSGMGGEQLLVKLEVAFDSGCLLRGVRAFMVADAVSSQGRIVRSEPEAEVLEGDGFTGDCFTLYVASEASPEALQAVVMTVSEIASCEAGIVSVVQETDAPPEPVEEAKRSGQRTDAGSHEQAPKADSREKGQQQNHQKVGQTVRVDVHRLDKLLNLVGELVIGRSRIERLARDSGLKEFEEPILQLGRISTEIQELVTKLRMVPVSFVFDRFPRLVRDLSQTLDKKVDLEIQGRETELDRSVINEIGDPLVHLIRNSLDHGFESTAERRRAGKSEMGRLRVRAYQDGSSVVIAVEDDGKGIDPRKIVEKALERGLLTEEQAESMTEREIFNLLFVAGFSTAEKVTDLSGRGVGMDAVKSKVEALGGRLMVESTPGKGTSVKIKLPITLAIVLALLVKVDERIYAIPLESVDETLLVQEDEVKAVNGSLVTMLRGAVLPLVDAREVYGLPRTGEREELSVVVMRTGSRRVGFVVDKFVGQQEIVIKSLGRKGIAKVQWFSGGTILGDGSVALIIDPAAVDVIKTRATLVQ